MLDSDALSSLKSKAEKYMIDLNLQYDSYRIWLTEASEEIKREDSKNDALTESQVVQMLIVNKEKTDNVIIIARKAAYAFKEYSDALEPFIPR